MILATECGLFRLNRRYLHDDLWPDLLLRAIEQRI